MGISLIIVFKEFPRGMRWLEAQNPIFDIHTHTYSIEGNGVKIKSVIPGKKIFK